MTAPDSWGCDVPISRPEPVPDLTPDSVDMGSHVFTPNGLRIYANAETLRELFTPTFSPPDGV